MDKPVKVLKSKSEIRRLFTNKIVNSEKVLIDGKTMYMTVNKIDDSGKEVKHKKNTKSKIRERRTGMFQTLNFPDIDYKESYPSLKNDLIENNKSVKSMRTILVKRGFHKSILNQKGLEFKYLSELEKYLFSTISSIRNIKDDELIDIFHKIQYWGGNQGMRIYVKRGGFDENFDIEIYRKFVERCLNFEKDGDWVQTVSKWTFESHMFGFNISFSTKHVRFWLYNKLKDDTLPIFDLRIQNGFNEIQGNNLKNNKEEHLEFYWKQMIDKSKKEDITLKQLERLLFNYWS
tara:strand:- start:108 stop:977 length:870 start_codon:yes stop_codon:yes gene_type:complete